IFETRSVRIAAEGTTVEIPVTADWGAGAYALVTGYRPLGGRMERAPVRAVGVAWLGVNPGARSLPITISAPEKILPRQKIELPVKVTIASATAAYITVAAIDEGVLQLTRFRTPLPVDFFFGKRRLGL